MVRYCGRDFSKKEMEQIRALIADHPSECRAALSRRVCDHLGWFKADGGLKEMSARVAMLRMQTDGLILALISFSASAWQCAPRDQYIGWSHEQRKRNLHLIINNSRFLILPWVQSKNLASKILAMAARSIAEDWQYRYNYRPVLLETFVEKGRFKGTCYKAANWQYMGQTKGRGKLGPAGKISVPIKDIWLYPIHADYRNILIPTP